ncbi:hypothetical protein K523DRAFT_131707 [Schizophyllum commune Tattone D]|nr:hypothetical protein K523DRAFT_131707 [Schizophyllum commune Tattone D]
MQPPSPVLPLYIRSWYFLYPGHRYSCYSYVARSVFAVYCNSVRPVPPHCNVYYTSGRARVFHTGHSGLTRSCRTK